MDYEPHLQLLCRDILHLRGVAMAIMAIIRHTISSGNLEWFINAWSVAGRFLGDVMMSRISSFLTQGHNQSAIFFICTRRRIPIEDIVWPLGAIHPVLSFHGEDQDSSHRL
jgi:hypothetical protein